MFKRSFSGTTKEALRVLSAGCTGIGVEAIDQRGDFTVDYVLHAGVGRKFQT